MDAAHGSYSHDFPIFTVGARIARPCREAAFVEGTVAA